MLRPLRPHQARALILLRQTLLSGVRRVMLQLPTGAGKTRLAAEVVKGALSKGNRVVFVVPAISLIDQAVRAFQGEGIGGIGVIQAGHPMTDAAAAVQVASVQTLHRRPLPDADVVVIDEAHRWFAVFERWMADPAWARIPFIGLSATPWAGGLGRHYQRLIVAATLREMIEAGVLSPFRVFAPSHPDLSGVRTKAGDFLEADLSRAMDRPELVAEVVTTWQRLAEERPTLCFGVGRTHARNLQRAFEAAAIPCGYVDAETPLPEREAIREDFHAGALRVVCNVGCLTTGVDWDVRCIVLARPTKSEMLFAQIIGRGLRTAEGKTDCLILDHSDTHRRLGFVTDIHHDALDDGSRGNRASAHSRRTPVECPTCAMLRPAHMDACPECGAGQTAQPAAELTEMKRADGKQAERQRWYSMLLQVAKERGYRSTWAAHKFHARFGTWPDGLRKKHLPPDAQVLAFVRDQNARFAREMGRHRSASGDGMEGAQA